MIVFYFLVAEELTLLQQVARLREEVPFDDQAALAASPFGVRR